jgi:farnesyl diphosphate synthase
MAGGQMMDLSAEGRELDLAAITRLQQLKTGALIEYCIEAACIMVKLAPDARTPLPRLRPQRGARLPDHRRL